MVYTELSTENGVLVGGMRYRRYLLLMNSPYLVVSDLRVLRSRPYRTPGGVMQYSHPIDPYTRQLACQTSVRLYVTRRALERPSCQSHVSQHSVSTQSAERGRPLQKASHLSHYVLKTLQCHKKLRFITYTVVHHSYISHSFHIHTCTESVRSMRFTRRICCM